MSITYSCVNELPEEYVEFKLLGMTMETKDWRQECLRLQAELDAVRAEMEDWKIKWERLMQFKDAPRLPLRGTYYLRLYGES